MVQCRNYRPVSAIPARACAEKQSLAPPGTQRRHVDGDAMQAPEQACGIANFILQYRLSPSFHYPSWRKNFILI
jgi:hypothetical protein